MNQTSKIKDAILKALEQIESTFCFNVVSELIQNQEKLVVNAREIYEQLGVKTEFRAWINRRLSEYNFVENQDFLCRSNLIASKSQSPKARNQVQKEYFVTLNTAKELCMVERTEQGREARLYFIHLEEKVLEILSENTQEISKNNYNPFQQNAIVLPIHNALAVADFVTRNLRMSESSVVNMASKICKNYDVNPNFLPEYIEQNPVSSLSKLLDEFKLTHLWTAQKLNLVLEAHGILEKITRKSTKTEGKLKSFWSFTSKGLQWGKNEVYPPNPRETQPLYFRNKFLDLLKLIQIA